jgi:hypothetical protein
MKRIRGSEETHLILESPWKHFSVGNELPVDKHRLADLAMSKKYIGVYQAYGRIIFKVGTHEWYECEEKEVTWPSQQKQRKGRGA